MRSSGGTGTARVARSQGVAFSKSPVLAVRLPSWRSRVVLFGMFIAFGALAARAVWLQGTSRQSQFLQEQGANRYQRTQELPAVRGKITDRNGQVLASSIPVRAIWAAPEELLAAPKEKIRALAGLLEMSEAELRKKLDSDRNLVYLKRQVEVETALDALLSTVRGGDAVLVKASNSIGLARLVEQVAGGQAIASCST